MPRSASVDGSGTAVGEYASNGPEMCVWPKFVTSKNAVFAYVVAVVSIKRKYDASPGCSPAREVEVDGRVEGPREAMGAARGAVPSPSVR